MKVYPEFVKTEDDKKLYDEYGIIAFLNRNAELEKKIENET